MIRVCNPHEFDFSKTVNTHSKGLGLKRLEIKPLAKIKTLVIPASLLVALIIAMSLTTVGLVNVSSNLHSVGSILTTAGISVYSDFACTKPLTSLDWGTLVAGGSTTNTVYIKNVGATTLTLSMQPTNWNPTNANGPLTVTWDKNSAALPPGQSDTAVLRLAVSPSITGISTFSVDVTISGTA